MVIYHSRLAEVHTGTILLNPSLWLPSNVAKRVEMKGPHKALYPQDVPLWRVPLCICDQIIMMVDVTVQFHNTLRSRL